MGTLFSVVHPYTPKKSTQLRLLETNKWALWQQFRDFGYGEMPIVYPAFKEINTQITEHADSELMVNIWRKQKSDEIWPVWACLACGSKAPRAI